MYSWLVFYLSLFLIKINLAWSTYVCTYVCLSQSHRSTDGKSISSSGMRNKGGEEYLSIQDQILYTEPTFDDDVDIWAKELISRLLDKNPSSRLGCMSGDVYLLMCVHMIMFSRLQNTMICIHKQECASMFIACQRVLISLIHVIVNVLNCALYTEWCMHACNHIYKYIRFSIKFSGKANFRLCEFECERVGVHSNHTYTGSATYSSKGGKHAIKNAGVSIRILLSHVYSKKIDTS